MRKWIYYFTVLVAIVLLGCEKKDNNDSHQFLSERGGQSTEKEKTYLEIMREKFPEDSFLADLKKRSEHGEDLNHQDKFTQTLLHKSVDLGYLSAVNFLLAQNVDVNIQNNYDMTALHLSLQMEHCEISERLIDFGADLNIVNKLGMTPLCYATTSEYVENKYDLMGLLIEKGADIDGTEKSESPLFLAISTKDNKALKLLIEKGGGVNHSNRFGDTPLFQALTSENVEAFEILLKHGADIQKKNSSGHSTLEHLYHREKDDVSTNFLKILDKYSK